MSRKDKKEAERAPRFVYLSQKKLDEISEYGPELPESSGSLFLKLKEIRESSIRSSIFGDVQLKSREIPGALGGRSRSINTHSRKVFEKKKEEE